MTLIRKNVGTDKDNWGTPWWLFNLLNKEFRFNGDVAATKENTKCPEFYNKEIDALTQDWFSRSFLNPPHSSKLVLQFMTKARIEAYMGAVVVCLVPVSSDTRWWHKNVMEAQEIRFIEGRVDYVGYDLEGKPIQQSPTFASCVVIFDKKLEASREYRLPCGLDDVCEEGYTNPEGTPCSMGYINCEGDPRPVIGKTITKPERCNR